MDQFEIDDLALIETNQPFKTISNRLAQQNAVYGMQNEIDDDFDDSDEEDERLIEGESPHHYQ